jgi:hypothetical protein
MSFARRRLRKEGTPMRSFTTLVLASLVTLTASVATAQPKAKGAAGNAGNAKVKVYDFSGDTIEGDLVKPEGVGISARDFTKHSSLIRIRKDFIAEILKSAEDL